MLTRALEVGPAGLVLLARAFCLLLAAKLALKTIPVRHIVAWKQRPVPSRATLPPAIETAERRRVCHAVLVVARYSPMHFVCFPQCLAAAALLRACGIESRLHYGVARRPAVGSEAPAALVTHTWLEAGGEVLIGGQAAADYSTLAVY